MRRVLLYSLIFGSVCLYAQNNWSELTSQEWSSMTVEQIVRYLDAGAEVNARNEDGRTPLHWPARYNENPEVVQVLLDAVADVNASNEDGWTALHFAARYNENAEVVQTLIDGRANPDVQDNDGYRPLMMAAEFSENPEVLSILIAAGANTKALNSKGETAWDLIASNEALKGSGAYWELHDRRFD